MGNTKLVPIDVVSKKIHDDILLINSLMHSANELTEPYEILTSDCSDLASKDLKSNDKKIQALEYINQACKDIKEAGLIARKLVSFYVGSRIKVPEYLINLSDQLWDLKNDLYQRKETLIYCIECLDNKKEREELREIEYHLDAINLTEFNGSPESMLVEAMSEVIDAKRKNGLSECLENKLIDLGLSVNRLNKKNIFDPFLFLQRVKEEKYQ